MDSKCRILYLLKILMERTDEYHPLSTNQLITILQDEYGFHTHRTTIASDITELQEFGIDIVIIHTTQNKFFIGKRKFELPELKLIIDAVESSKFITSKKSQELIDKIYTLASRGQKERLKRNNYVVNRIKPDNEQIYYIVDVINKAINEKKKISFKYFDYTGLKTKVLRHFGELYTISPYKMVWTDDYYYVVGYSDKRDTVVSFRVDRIATIPEVSAEDAVPIPEEFSIKEFSKTSFSMYIGETIQVDLRCDNSLMKTIVDKFGEDVLTLAYDMNSFRIITDVEVSPTFFRWIFGFCGKIQIIGPQKVKDQYIEMLTKELDNQL